MKSYHSPKTEVKKSNFDGLGLFAKESIEKDEIVAIKNGHIFGIKTFEELGGFNSDIGRATLQIADEFFVGALNAEEIKDIMLYLNHSCNPNVGKMGNIITVAMRNIEAGEELLSDYATYISYPKFYMECLCKAQNCRGTIGGNDWKNEAIKEKYGKYMSAYLKDKF